MSPIQDAKKTLEELKAAYTSKNWAKCGDLVSKFKVSMVDFSSLPPFASTSGPVNAEEVSLAREALELAVLVSTHQHDSGAFERNFEMLRPYYYDCRKVVAPSAKEPLITGLNLLRLLGENRVSDFHTELELLPAEAHASPLIRQPLEVEQWLMEGSYKKVLSASSNLVAPEFAPFMTLLTGTVRNEIASCIEKSYPSISVDDAAQMLGVPKDQLASYAQSRNWIVQANRFVFPDVSGESAAAPGAKDIRSQELIQNALQYARELERIV